jgi:hypothetical protein
MKTEVRSTKTEVGRPKMKVRSTKSEDGRLKKLAPDAGQWNVNSRKSIELISDNF